MCNKGSHFCSLRPAADFIYPAAVDAGRKFVIVLTYFSALFAGVFPWKWFGHRSFLNLHLNGDRCALKGDEQGG